MIGIPKVGERRRVVKLVPCVYAKPAPGLQPPVAGSVVLCGEVGLIFTVIGVEFPAWKSGSQRFRNVAFVTDGGFIGMTTAEQWNRCTRASR